MNPKLLDSKDVTKKKHLVQSLVVALNEKGAVPECTLEICRGNFGCPSDCMCYQNLAGGNPGLLGSCIVCTVWYNEKLSYIPQDIFCIPLDIHMYKDLVMSLACYFYTS